MASTQVCCSMFVVQTPLVAPFCVTRFFAGGGWEDTAVIVVDRKVEPKRGGANVSKQVCAPDFWWRVQPKSWTSETTKQASELDIWRCHFGILFYFGNFEPLGNYSAHRNHIPQYTMTTIIHYTLLPPYPTKDDRRFHGGQEPIDWGGLGGMDFGRLNFGMMEQKLFIVFLPAKPLKPYPIVWQDPLVNKCPKLFFSTPARDFLGRPIFWNHTSPTNTLGDISFFCHFTQNA